MVGNIRLWQTCRRHQGPTAIDIDIPLFFPPKPHHKLSPLWHLLKTVLWKLRTRVFPPPRHSISSVGTRVRVGRIARTTSAKYINEFEGLFACWTSSIVASATSLPHTTVLSSDDMDRRVLVVEDLDDDRLVSLYSPGLISDSLQLLG